MELEDSPGGFQELNDELMTYSFSTQMAQQQPKAASQTRKQIHQQKPRLQLLRQPTVEQHVSFTSGSSKTAIGKVIKFGDCTFRSDFESGNLCSVECLARGKFQITLQLETNSSRRSGWFYFACEGLKGEVQFCVLGFTKSKSLYSHGMKVCCRQLKQGATWRRTGSKIAYSAYQEAPETTAYCLRFTYIFKGSSMAAGVQFAYCYPYTYSRLLVTLPTLGGFKCESLGQSHSGRNIPMVTIGNQKSPHVIVFSARVHPGETVSSFIVEGLMKALCGDSEAAQLLRSHFLVRVVPMLNPDGVVAGNYRFSAAGFDLNRKWKTPKVKHHPEIYLMKKMLHTLNSQRKVIMYVDIHGHSRKKNVFFYGCCPSPENQAAKEFPFLMSRISPFFKFEYCSFNIDKEKEGTARVTMWNDLHIDNVFTLQSSLCGSESGGNYSEPDLLNIGAKLAEGTAVFFSGLVDPSIAKGLVEMKESFISELKNNSQLLSIGMMDSAGSDSEPEVGETVVRQRSGLLEAVGPKTTLDLFTHEISKESQKAQVNKLRLNSMAERHSQRSNKNHVLTMNSRMFLESLDEPEESIPPQIAITKPFTSSEGRSKCITSDQSLNLVVSSIYRKNKRVHSRNVVRTTDRIRGKPYSQHAIPDDPVEEVHMLRIENRKKNLFVGQQGAQYRRVKKFAEESNRRRNISGGSMHMELSGLAAVSGPPDSATDRTTNGVSPFFYPYSQKGKRPSVESQSRKHAVSRETDRPKFFVNGDELMVRCMGNRIGF